MVAKRIMIVEDEHDMAELVAMRLLREQYEVEVAHDGLEALRKIRSNPPDLVLLDLMLPKMSGMDVAKELRGDSRTGSVPIIMLTAKGEESDVVLGLHVGADDYIVKPFSMSVLIARVAAVLRRAQSGDKADADILRAGPILIDRQRHHVQVAGEPVMLTLTEFRLLAAIVAARGRVLTRDQLINKGMGINAVVTDRTIDVHVTSLRRKLGKARKHIKTVRGVGYCLAGIDDEAT